MRSLTAFAVAAFLVAGAAQANVTKVSPLGTFAPGAGTSAYGTPAAGMFDEQYSFSLSSASSLSSSAVVLNLLNTYDISGGVVSLYSGTSSTALASYSFDTMSGGNFYTQGLAAGAYHFDVTGLAYGTKGGSYLLNLSVAAVPEPETYALMGLGLVALVAARSRRKAK